MTRFDMHGFTREVDALAAKELSSVSGAAGLGGLVAAVVDMAEEALAHHLDAAEAAHIACRAGCGSCCVVNVSVLFPEAVAIVDYLQRCPPTSARARQEERLDALFRDSRWLDDEERLFLRRPCAFLDTAGACTIYPVRPLLCRAVTSTDPEACRQAIAFAALGETRPVQMNLFQKSLMEAAYAGLGRALETAGLDGRGLRLTVAVKQLLDDPGLAAGFAAGGRLKS